MATIPTAKFERWQRFRANRDKALASRHGWLTLTSFQWLAESPSAVDLAPGLWSVRGTDADGAGPGTAGPVESPTAVLTAVPADGLSLVATGEPVAGTLTATLADGESLMWVQFGGAGGDRVVVELAMRAGRYAIRTRDSESPVVTGFSGVPTYAYNPDWEVTAAFEPFPEPVDVPIATANPLVDGIHRSVGEVVFRLPGSPHAFRLQAEAEKLGALTVTFHDETNGDTTDDWRKLSAPRPRPNPDGTASVILDFNRAINYPSAFTPYGTCPMPVRNNSLDIRVEAGEKLPYPQDFRASAEVPRNGD